MNTTGIPLFAVYAGHSMHSTLQEPEIMEIIPYHTRPLRVGDVVFFLPPQKLQAVVHRVVRMTPAGISTRGDNNTREDAYLLQTDDIKGQVVAAWHGQNRREIAGGLQGWLTGRWLRWRSQLDRGVSYLLHPLYGILSRCGSIAAILPARLRPRVVVFRARGQDQFKLMSGSHIVGRYDERKRQWQIQRPFRLFVDEGALQTQQFAIRNGSLGLTGKCRVP